VSVEGWVEGALLLLAGGEEVNGLLPPLVPLLFAQHALLVQELLVRLVRQSGRRLAHAEERRHVTHTNLHVEGAGLAAGGEEA
jgi:hypothetical protein